MLEKGNFRNFRTRTVFLIVVWTLLLVLSLSLLSIVWSSFSNNPQSQNISSLSWAGYAITKNSANPQIEVTEISASWIIPQLNVSAGDGYSSVWIGIGGQLDKTLIQVGTEQDVVNGQEAYFAWYELLPNTAIRLDEITVSPGDTMLASINLVNANTNEWSLQMRDASTFQGFSRNVVYNSTRSSAEWILERPTIENQIATLANFGSVTFADCNVNVNNVTGALGKFLCSKILMTDGQNVELTSVSGFTPTESSFTVSYLSGK